MKTQLSFFILVFANVLRCFAADMAGYAWGPVSNSVKMSIMVKSDSELLSQDDIRVSAIIERLRAQSDPVSSFIWLSLSKEEQSVLMEYQPSSQGPKRGVEVVVQTFNRIICGPSMYKEDRFKGIVVRGEAKAIMQQDPHGSMLARLNRILLEDAYPVELSRNLKAGDPTIKRGDPVILMIAITNMSSSEVFDVSTAKDIENDDRFSLQVVSPSGKQVPAHGEAWRSRAQTLFSLDPIERPQLTFTFPLNAICKCDEIGSYTVTAYREVRWPGGKKEYVSVVDDDGTTRKFAVDAWFTVVSNPLFIKIVPNK